MPSFALYLKYAMYFPYLFQLVQFIRQAELIFKDKAKSGAEKSQWVVDHFIPIITGAVELHIIPQKLADQIVNNLPGVIAIIVQFINAVHGFSTATKS